MLRGRQLSLRHPDKGVSALFSTHSLRCKESIELKVGAMAFFILLSACKALGSYLGTEAWFCFLKQKLQVLFCNTKCGI